eukprot:scaffold382_cov380-Prasinococcus_capsulatus_cf.AAC.31
MTERKEFKLWTDRKTREHYENLADLFAIIKTTDKLEKAWIRASSMPAKVPTPHNPVFFARRPSCCGQAPSRPPCLFPPGLRRRMLSAHCSVPYRQDCPRLGYTESRGVYERVQNGVLERKATAN